MPFSGGYMQQPNKLMQQLEHLRRVKQGIFQGKPKTNSGMTHG